MDTEYLRSLRTALVGDAGARLVLVCNFEAETEWASGHIGLPTPALSSSTALVRRMEELGTLLAGPGDTLLIKQPLDPAYRTYLEDLGLHPPATLVPEHVTPDRPTAQDALASPQTMRLLTDLAAAGAQLLPMGTTVWEQRLAEACGMPLAVPDAAVFERVNSKIYGRRVAAAAELICVPGACCESVTELGAVLDGYRDRLGQDGFQVVVKDAYGVSGKGMVVLDSPARSDRLLRMVQRRAERTGEARLEVVLEQWLPKRFDLNYQLTIDRAGCTTLDFVKQALTENGVHKGHIMPADLTGAQRDEIARAAELVGRRLYADGYRGIAGIDAILAASGRLYPVLEINARLNMSTYQGGVTERMQGPGQVAMARHYPLRLDGPRRFDALRRTLAPVLDRHRDGQCVVTCFGTVNANAHLQPPFEGRLYTMLVAPNHERLAALDASAQAALDRLPALQETS